MIGWFAGKAAKKIFKSSQKVYKIGFTIFTFASILDIIFKRKK